MARQGKVFASGPFDGGKTGDGLTILRAVGLDEAREIASRDPFVVAGLRSFEVREWLLMEGSIGITVNYSDQSTTVT